MTLHVLAGTESEKLGTGESRGVWRIDYYAKEPKTVLIAADSIATAVEKWRRYVEAAIREDFAMGEAEHPNPTRTVEEMDAAVEAIGEPCRVELYRHLIIL